MALQMALLYALDLSVLHRREDGEELSKMLPLVEDPELIPRLLDALAPQPATDAPPAHGTAGSGARGLCQLALGLALAALKRGGPALAALPALPADLLDQDDALVDAAIDGKVFEYLDEAMLSTDYVWKEEYYQLRIHYLITDFIVLMHSKFMEMRAKADEAARAVATYAMEGVAPPAGVAAGRLRLEALLRCVARLYRRDPRCCRLDYWRAVQPDQRPTSGTCPPVHVHGVAPHCTAGVAAGRLRLEALLRCVARLYRRDPRCCRLDYWRAVQPDQRYVPARTRTRRSATLHRGRGGGAAAAGGAAALRGAPVPPRPALLPPGLLARRAARPAGPRAPATPLPKFVGAGEWAGPLLARVPRPLGPAPRARPTFPLLARRDHLAAHHLLAALQRYHRSLRLDAPPFSEHQHSSMGASAIVTPAARPGKLLVRHEEVEAMVGALKLIASVARQDEAAAASICENLQWDAVNCMFGLVCCHVPIQLKAELLKCLAALGGRPATAGRVWAALEAAQLLVGVWDERRAPAADLLEVECRMEEYPMSRAFVQLLLALVKAGPAPRALGAGSRPPGLQPYVRHVLRRLALPAPARPHARPHRRWQMLSLCFRLFALWLEQYSPSAADFPAAGRAADVEPPPGFPLLLELHSRSDLLRLVLSAVAGALQLLPTQPLHATYVEQTLVCALRILERALTLERAIMAAAAAAPRAPILVGLSKLLLASEVESEGWGEGGAYASLVGGVGVGGAGVGAGAGVGEGGADRVVLCCRVVQLGGAAALKATRLLMKLLEAPHAARHLMAALAHHHDLAAQIRHGFVECLEAEEWAGEDAMLSGLSGEELAEVVGEEAGPGGLSAAGLARRAQAAVLALLHSALPAAPPNLAHFLLGYQLADDLSRSTLHEAGGARSCWHAVLDLLDQHVAGHAADRGASELVESCYRLVYWVVARPASGPPALRYLRARDYFLARHAKAAVGLQVSGQQPLQLVPAGALGGGAARQRPARAALPARARLLPGAPRQGGRGPAGQWAAAAAAELVFAQKADAVTLSARSWVLRACACEAGAAAAGRHHAALAALLATHQEWQWCLIRRTLDGLPVTVPPAAEPHWELFHAHQLRKALAACDIPT
ncbi:hypothetical protein ACJJTC_000352, partial [Scirpophaga incertulas]